MKTVFWLSILIIIYVYIIYPASVYLLSLFYKKPWEGKYFYPNLSILISAYNEEKNIERKILSLLFLDYPKEKLEILIGSDGSTDKTDEIVSKYVDTRVKLYRQPTRQGKPNMLNMLASKASGESLIFTDARQRLDRNALKELVKNFAEEKVGSVSAELLFENENNKPGNGIGLYWRYEKFIRKCESRIGSMLGATGALYAIRKELFSELPSDLILDDVYIPLNIVRKGYRAIFDSKAKVYDKVVNNPKEEFLRKTRTLAGNFQLFVYLKELLNPLKGRISWQFFSHKFLRLLVPFLLVAVFISNLFILKSYFYITILIMQIIFYSLALFGTILKEKNHLIDIPYMFCVMNSAAVMGLYRFISKKQSVMWEKAMS